MIAAIDERQPAWPDFDAAVHTAAVVDAVIRSVDERRWVRVGDILAGGAQ